MTENFQISRQEYLIEAVEEYFKDGYPKGKILLVGSSIIEYWSKSQVQLMPAETINLGIADTAADQQADFFERLVMPFEPKKLVVYIGSNDIPAFPVSDNVASETADKVIAYLKKVSDTAGNIPIFYLSILEAPCKKNVLSAVREANRIIADYCSKTRHIVFVDINEPLRKSNGEVDKSYYLPDMLHLREPAYELFADLLRPMLTGEH